YATYTAHHIPHHSFPTRRSSDLERKVLVGDRIETDRVHRVGNVEQDAVSRARTRRQADFRKHRDVVAAIGRRGRLRAGPVIAARDRKSTRLNSSHVEISYAVFCL